MPTPYAQHVGDEDPVSVLRTSLDEFRALIPKITPALWRQPWAPGKWTVAEVMLHVVQWEMILSIRVRCGVAIPNFTVQPMEQDPFIDLEKHAVDGPTAAATFLALRQMNLALAASLTPEQRTTAVNHPERGRIDVNDMLTTLAGHPVHHLRQLQGLVGQA
jgi:hypothetical protein